MSPLFGLVFITFAILVGFLMWNKMSTSRSGKTASGIGGPNDPMAGATKDMRSPDDMRASLDVAASVTADSPNYVAKGTALKYPVTKSA